MILHFVIDGKLTDQIIENFLTVSPKNHFLVFGERNDNGHFNRITKIGSFISTYSINKSDINKIITEINPAAIILHSLTNDFAKVLLKINAKIKICWYEWGFDVYGLPKIEPKTYAPKTKRVLLKKNPRLWFEWQIKKHGTLRNLFIRKVLKKEDFIDSRFKAMRKIDFFSTYIQEDYYILKKYYPEFNFKFINAAFSTIDQYLAGNLDLAVSPNANNILLGNSNTANSNYIDSISILSKKKDNFEKAYTVLSYGACNIPVNEIIKHGERELKDQFAPMLEFIKREDYLKILQSCSVGVFYQYRQRAMGNIIAMLYMGSRVYLSTKNPSYNFFIRNNIIVNNLENEFDKFGVSTLSAKEVENNRIQLNKIFSKEKVINDLRNLIQALTK